MAVYVGPSIYPYGRMIMCHMVADTLNELHEMADMIDLSRRHFQKKNSRPHYDISKNKRVLAIEHGAKDVDERKIIEILRQFQIE